MNLSKTLWDITKGMGNATGLPYLINTTITNPIKQLTAQATGNKVAYRNAGRAYEKPVKRQLQEWGGNSASALLPFVAGGLASKLPIPPANSLAQKALLGMGQGGILGGAMNVTGTYGAGGDPTLKTFGQGALVGGLIGGASPLGRAAWLANKKNLPQAPPTISTSPSNTNPHLYQANQHLSQIERSLRQENLPVSTFKQLAKAREEALKDIIHINKTGLPMAVKPKGGVYGAAKQAQLSKQDANAQWSRDLVTNYFDNQPVVKGSALTGEGAKASSGALSSQARRDALAKKMGYNIKRK